MLFVIYCHPNDFLTSFHQIQIDPGPEDDSLITQQARHRSILLWDVILGAVFEIMFWIVVFLHSLRMHKFKLILSLIMQHMWLHVRHNEQNLRVAATEDTDVGRCNVLIRPYLEQTEFLGVSLLPYMKVDHHLITTLVERWCPETHTFHMHGSETTVTLQDVGILFGISVDGESVCGITYGTEWAAICERLLERSLPMSALKG